MVLSSQLREGLLLGTTTPIVRVPRRRAKSQHAPSIQFGYARKARVLEDSTRVSYEAYKDWCQKIGLPVAEFHIWRRTNARIPNA